MRYFAAAVSVTGKVRKNNEDNFSLNDCYMDLGHGDQAAESTLEPGRTHLVGVYDGMGGHSDGEMASYIAAGISADRFEEISRIPGNGRVQRLKLEELCFDANRAVCREAEKRMSNMGTTCVMLCLHGSAYAVCNVGDSPVFRFREGTLEQLSVDHNGRAQYERITGMPAPEKKKFPLTQCIGIPEDEMKIEPYSAEGCVQDGDIFLLCSDGITDMVPRQEICRILAEYPDARAMRDELIRQALEGGGRDNATAVVVQAQACEPAREASAESAPEALPRRTLSGWLRSRLGIFRKGEH